MSLRELAAADAQLILSDEVGGFGWAATLTNQDGDSTPITGFSVNTMELGDVETGQGVQARRTSFTFPLRQLPAGWERPEGTAREDEKPWRVDLLNIVNGDQRNYAVDRTDPDDTLGILVMHLIPYTPPAS